MEPNEPLIPRVMSRIPDITRCPACRRLLENVRSVSPGEKPSNGDIYLCGDCAAVSTFQPEGLRLLTAEEFDAMTPEERADLIFAARACAGRAAQRVQKLNIQVFLTDRNGNNPN